MGKGSRGRLDNAFPLVKVHRGQFVASRNAIRPNAESAIVNQPGDLAIRQGDFESCIKILQARTAVCSPLRELRRDSLLIAMLEISRVSASRTRNRAIRSPRAYEIRSFVESWRLRGSPRSPKGHEDASADRSASPHSGATPRSFSWIILELYCRR